MRKRLFSTVISRCSLRIPASSTFTTRPLSVTYTSVLGTQWARAAPSRAPPTERVTKCTVELTLHMAIQRNKFISTTPPPPGDHFLFHPPPDPSPFCRRD